MEKEMIEIDGIKYKRVKEGKVIYHGGCHGCKAQELHGMGYCCGCQYKEANWDLPDLSIKDKPKFEVGDWVIAECVGIKDYLIKISGIKNGKYESNCWFTSSGAYMDYEGTFSYSLSFLLCFSDTCFILGFTLPFLY